MMTCGGILLSKEELCALSAAAFIDHLNLATNISHQGVSLDGELSLVAAATTFSECSGDKYENKAGQSLSFALRPPPSSPLIGLTCIISFDGFNNPTLMSHFTGYRQGSGVETHYLELEAIGRCTHPAHSRIYRPWEIGMRCARLRAFLTTLSLVWCLLLCLIPSFLSFSLPLLILFNHHFSLFAACLPVRFILLPSRISDLSHSLFEFYLPYILFEAS